MKNKIYVVLFFVLIFLIGMKTSKTAPNNAIVYADPTQKMYYAPPYFSDNGIVIPPGLAKTTIENVRSKKFQPDPTCRDQGYFVHDAGSLFTHLLQIPEKQRWNNDGTWNW